MDWKIMVEVCMSILFFAPLLIAFTAFLFIGAAILFEWVAQIARGAESLTEKVAGTSTPAGPIVSGLKASIEETDSDVKKIAK